MSFSSRLQLVQNHLSGSTKEKSKIVASAVDYLYFDDLLTPEEKTLRKEIREFMEKEVAPVISRYVEKAEFPYDIVHKIGEKEWIKLFLKRPYGKEVSHTSYGLASMELARVDAGIATFLVVQMGLALYTLELFASDKQKQKYYDDFIKCRKLVGWGLTEENYGSDASSISSTVAKVDGGYRLNGDKRWIGNSNGDYVIVWAKDRDTKEIGAYLVPLKQAGVQVEIIKHKLALRIVQNGQLRFNNVFIPEENKLPGAKGFESVNKVLEHSRLFVAWMATGVALGVYDNVIKYIDNRKQFGKKISGFQLSQEKLSRIMAITQAMLTLVWRVTRLYEQGKATIGRAAMTKAWATKMAREVAQLGRELMGGNGIIHDNYTMKALADMEALYTYEGTYDVNVLINGRELTGIAAFK